MFKNYLTVAYRNLLKNKFLAFSNIIILSLVIATILHLFKYVAFEKSFDKFHEGSENLYRVNTHLISGNGTTDYAISHGFLGSMMNEKYSSVTDFITLTPLSDDCTIVYEDKVFREKRVFEVDSTFFEVLSFPLIVGDPSTVLDKPGTVVLTESMAKKYFRDENPIGKSVKIKGKYGTYMFEITGICKDFPKNSHIQMDWICSNHHLFEVPEQYYHFEMAMNHWTFVRLNGGKGAVEEVTSSTNEELEKMQLYKTSDVEISLMPISDVHLKSTLQGELGSVSGGYHSTVLLVILIGAGCFIITYLNFINISLVKTIERTKEVGIRNVLGANFSNNLGLFFIEALIQVVLALIISFVIFFATIDTASQYFNFPYNFNVENEINFYVLFIGAFLAVSVVISLIYAVIFSRVQPLNALKDKSKILTKKITAKTAPIIVQFAICILFLSFTLIVFQQVHFMYNKDLGFKKDNIVFILQPHIEDFWNMSSRMQTFDAEAKKHPSVAAITRSVYNPGSNGYAQWGGVSNEKTGKDNFQMFAHNEVMYNYFELYGMKLIAGSFFTQDNNDDIVVNYTACKRLGFTEPRDIIGTDVFVKHKNMNKRVIGVIEDFHQESLKFATEPVIFHLEKNNMRHTTAVKLNTDNYSEAIQSLKESWAKVFPESEFVYTIFSEEVNKLYENEARFQKWLNLFCLLTLVISSFGIFIIAYYTFKEREKEIAIHKVLGASTFNIMGLSKTFVRLMIIAIVAGLAASFFLSKEWLQNYEYHIDINAWFFVVPILVVSFFFLITLLYSVNKAASNNPVKALRSE